MSSQLARAYEDRLAVERQICDCVICLRIARTAHNKRREKAILRKLSRLRAHREQWASGARR